MNVTTTLDTVTVFRQGALCVRTAKLEAPSEGASAQLRLIGLPLSLAPGSLRARVEGGAPGLRVLDVRPAFEVALREAVDAPAEQQALEAARETLARLETALERLSAQIQEVESLRPQFLEQRRGDPPRVAPVGTMMALGDFVSAQLEAHTERRRTLERERKDAYEAVRLHERRLKEASTAQRTERAQVSRCAVLTLSEVPAAGVTVSLEYEVPGARWTPGYELRLEKGFTGGALAMRASVAQRTGEDWAGVQLALSTASLSRRTDVPELRSLRIGRTQPEPPRPAWREPPPGLDALFEGYDSVARLLPPALPQEPAPAARPLGHISRTDEREERMSRKKEKAKKGGRAPMAPPAPPPPAPRMAPGAGGMPPSAKALSVSDSFGNMATGGAPMMSRSAAPMPSRMRAQAAPEREMMMEMAASAEEAYADAGMLDEDLDGDDREEITGVGLRPGQRSEPELSLEADLLDYGRLAMGAPDAPSARGKLTPMGQWDHAFAVGVSVSVDVVVALVTKAHQKAQAVQSLALPSSCEPVGSLNAFDYRYDCATRVDVPSTGAWQTVPVMGCAVELKPEYVTVPSLEQKVYRTLLVKNATPHALLAGPVDVLAGDQFLLTTSLPPIPPGADSLRLGLGVEEAIKVARKTQYKETTGGFLGGSAVLPHELSVELNNRLSAPALVEVRERLPVPDASEKDLKVEEEKVEPAWEKVEGPLDGQVVAGTRRWRVTVPAGQRQVLTAQFTVRMPADRMLVGGNRRL